MPRVKESTVPPGGWHFFQKLSGGRTTKVLGTNFKSLVENVLVTRLGNAIAPGEVETEVEAYICGLARHQCLAKPEIGNREAVLPENHKPGMVKRWVDVILEWGHMAARSRSGFGGVVSQTVAEERARICAQCSFNLRWQGQCPKCVESAKQVLSRLRQGKRVAGKMIAPRLGGCRHHRWDNETACFLAEPESSGDGQTPGNCWVNRIKA